MSFGDELRRRRLAAGLTLGQFALVIHYSKSYLSKIETGTKTPSDDLARQCDAALHAGGALLRLAPAGTPAPPTDDPLMGQDGRWIINLDADGRGEFGAVGRRSLLMAGGLSVLTWAVSPGAGHAPNITGEFGSFRSMFDETRKLAQTLSPAAMIPVLIAQTHALRLIASDMAWPARRQVLVLASRYAELTGWMAQEAGDNNGALWWTYQAVDLATAGGDSRLAAYALVRRGDIALYERNASDTVVFAQQAQALTSDNRVRGLAAQREAQGHALAGDELNCKRALDRANGWLDAATAEDHQPVLGSTTIGNPVMMATGWCLYDLGRTGQACGLLGEELERVSVGASRARARVGARYALALAGSGEVEQACDETRRVLDALPHIQSATVVSDLRRLSRQLNRWPSNARVRDVLPDLTAALVRR